MAHRVDSKIKMIMLMAECWILLSFFLLLALRSEVFLSLLF